MEGNKAGTNTINEDSFVTDDEEYKKINAQVISIEKNPIM